jgi:hypothetical protein
MKTLLWTAVVTVGLVFANPFVNELNSPTLTEPVEFAGTGDDFFPLTLNGPAVVRLTHDGSKNFMVFAFEADQQRTVLVNEIGTYVGDRPLGFSGDLPIEIELKADGNWTLTVLPLSRVPVGAPQLTGQGSAVLNITDVSGSALSLTHDGTKNFMVFAWADRRTVLVNHIGDYSGRMRLPAGTAFLEIVADGGWSLSIE